MIGAGTKKELVGEDIRRLMAGGAEISDLEQELVQFNKLGGSFSLGPPKFLENFKLPYPKILSLDNGNYLNYFIVCSFKMRIELI